MKSMMAGACFTAGLLLCAGAGMLGPGCGTPALRQEVRRTSATITPLAPQSRTPLDVVLVIDQSGSMSGAGDSVPTDPDHFRIEAAQYLVQLVARRPATRLGIISFGKQAEIDAPLTDTSAAGAAEALRASLQPKNMGWTKFVAALDAAVQVFREGKTFERGAKPVLIIFTDGEPEDERKLTLEQYFQEMEAKVRSELAGQRCELFVVGINDASRGWERSRDAWANLAGRDRVVTLTDMRQLRPTLSQILYPEMTLDQVPPEGLSFEVPPYLDSIQFHVFPETPDIELNVRKPDGQPLDRSGDDVNVELHEEFQIVTVDDPEPGAWQYIVAEGAGRVEVYRNPVAVRLAVVEPTPDWPLGRPFTLRIAVQRESGRPVAELPQHPLRLVARVWRPGADDAEDLLLEREEGNVFRYPEPFETGEPGKWEIKAILSGGHAYSFSETFLFESVSRPFIVIDYPAGDTVPLGHGLPLQVRVLLAGQPLDVRSYFSESPMNLLIAQCPELPGGGGSSGAVFLNPLNEGVNGAFEGFIPVDLQTPGAGMLAVQLQGQRATDGAVVHDVHAAGFFVGLSPAQERLLRMRYALLAAGAAATLLILLLVAWYFRKPVIRRFDAQLRFDYSSGEMDVKGLSGKRLVFGRLKRSGPALELGAEDDGEAATAGAAKLPGFFLAYAERGPSGDAADELALDPHPVLILRTGLRLRRRTLQMREPQALSEDGSVTVTYD